MAKTERGLADHILPLYMNGLAGRMLRLPAPSRYKREILLVYGHHSSIERMIGVAEFLNKYGAVTMPDLPGFGGMEPFYKIGKKPTIENLADYLAAFVKLRYNTRRLTIVGVSFGFPVVARMLQKYPEITKKNDLLISLSGFTNKDDFRWKRRNFLLLRWTTSILSNRLPAALARHTAFNPTVIRAGYKLFEDRNAKLRDASPEERKKRIDFEVKLWRDNDLRTYTETGVSMLKLNLADVHVDLAVHHISVGEDRYFDDVLVEQHMRQIFTDFELIKAHSAHHSVTVIASAKDVAAFVPAKVRSLLRQKV